MKKIGTIDLEILQLAINEKGTFNENSLENSELKRLGVGKILDTLASLKDKKYLSLNSDGSFSITGIAKEILWSNDIPIWAKLLRLLQIKSCNIEQIVEVIGSSKELILEDLEKLRKNQFILMSPQRIDEKLIKIYEIQQEGIDRIDKTDVEGFGEIDTKESVQELEILSLIDEIILEIGDSQLDEVKKNNLVEKLLKLKNKLQI